MPAAVDDTSRETLKPTMASNSEGLGVKHKNVANFGAGPAKLPEEVPFFSLARTTA